MTRLAGGALAAVLTVGVIGPILTPLAGLIARPAALGVFLEWGRLGGLYARTVLLASGAAAVALALALPIAVLLERGAIARGRLLFVAALAFPPPVLVLAWGALVGGAGAGFGAAAWGWGLGGAVLVHGWAGVPWAALIVSAGLRGVDRAREEDALMRMSPLGVVWRVTLPAALPAIRLAALAVAAFALTEVSVTDALQVRSAAEEVYTQAVVSGTGLDGSLAAALPPALLLAFLAARMGRTVSPGETARFGRIRLIPSGGMLQSVHVIPVAAGVALVLIPFGTLLSLAGRDPAGAWSVATLTTTLASQCRANGILALTSTLEASLAAVLAVGLSLALLEQARGSANWRRAALVLGLACASLPGPLVGVGLKGWIDALLWIEANVLGSAGGVARALLYDEPASPVPAVWAAVLRAWPWAAACLWPAIAARPAALDDLARLDGLGPLARLRRVTLPTLGPALPAALGAAGVLAIAELSASRLVQIPGRETLVAAMYAQMHYGTGSAVAALALLLVLAGGLVGLLAAVGKFLPEFGIDSATQFRLLWGRARCD